MHFVGEEIHGEVSSADASGGVSFTYTGQDGRTKTVGSRNALMITGFNIVSVPGGDVKLLATDGVTTVYLFRGTVGANGGAARALTTPFAAPRGYTLKVVAPAGQVDAQVEGFITR